MQGNLYVITSIRLGEEGKDIQEDAIIKEVIAGRKEAFRLLIDSYHHYLYQTVNSVVRNHKDAEDVVQEAWVAVYFSLSRYEFRGFKTWITRIAVNKAIDYTRKRKTMKENSSEVMTGVPVKSAASSDELSVTTTTATSDELPEFAFLQKEKERLVRDGLSGIPPNYRTVIQAYYMEDKSYQEIADEYGIELKSVESKLYRARNWIRKHWKEEDFQ